MRTPGGGGGGEEPFAATRCSTANNLNFLFFGKQGESDVSLSKSDFHQPLPTTEYL